MITGLVLKEKRFEYTRLKAITWTANKTVLPGLFQAAAGNALAELVSNGSTNKPLVVDCSGIYRVSDHAFDALNEALATSKRPVVLTGIKRIAKELREAIEVGYQAPTNDMISFNDLSASRATNLIASCRKAETALVANAVKACFVPYGKLERLSSTPLLANGAFDARAITASPSRFVWISLLLADRLSKILSGPPRDHETGNPRIRRAPIRLLSITMRSSPFAAAVALLEDLHGSLEIIDHFGPKYGLVEEHQLTPELFRGLYVLICDFLIGGTEVRIARTYAETRGASLAHVLGIGTLLAPNEYGAGVEISSLLQLSDTKSGARFYVFEP